MTADDLSKGFSSSSATNDISQHVVLAPMVRGSELAFRMLLRNIYQSPNLLCYSPMLRASKVFVPASTQEQNVYEDTQLFLHDLGTNSADTKSLVVQLCGSSPSELYAATVAILERYPTIHGIDLNLGCPQSCARDGGFGAFLAPPVAVSCLQAMRRAIQERSIPAVLSCKIRLQETEDKTIAFAKSLQAAGIDRIAVHCRERNVKFDGQANLEIGRKLVEALDIPVWINGASITNGMQTVQAVMQTTGSPKLMIARDLLANPRLFEKNNENDVSADARVAAMAADYLVYAARYPPPTPEYIQVHMKWMFRSTLQPRKGQDIDYTNWRHRLWNFLRRPYLQSLEQFRYVVALFAAQAQCARPTSLPDDIPLDPTYNTIRHLHKVRKNKESSSLVDGESSKKPKLFTAG